MKQINCVAVYLVLLQAKPCAYIEISEKRMFAGGLDS
jgi:hypothetical protein